MPKIRPFTGIRYDLSRGGRLEDVVAPPYDVISPEHEERLRARSAHNIVRLDLPRDEDGKDRYQVAGELFDQWLSSGALAKDPEPCIYVSKKPGEQDFSKPVRMVIDSTRATIPAGKRPQWVVVRAADRSGNEDGNRRELCVDVE